MNKTNLFILQTPRNKIFADRDPEPGPNVYLKMSKLISYKSDEYTEAWEV